MPEDAIFDHPQLGPIKGVVLPEGGLQFRNILYAAIPERWQHSVVVDDLRDHVANGGPYDATDWGPMAPQPNDTIKFDFGLIQKALPVDHEVKLDEMKCLNLVLTLPKMSSNTPIPVLVFIHGGGFFLGGNAWPQYDIRQLVKLAASIGKPIIGIGINYRLGLLGSLASDELTEAAAVGNFGLTDQTNALRWIQKHISGFNGDPQNVTVMGESAGAISTWMHILRGEPLFTRAICMAGNPRLRQPQSVESAKGMYGDLLQYLDLDKLSVSERTKHLRTIPWESLISLPQNMRCYPTLSGGFQDISENQHDAAEQLRSSLKWCKTLVIGDCELDATPLVPMLNRPNWYPKLRGILADNLNLSEVEEIVQTYQLDQEFDSSAGVHLGLVELASDIRFYMPVVAAASLTSSTDNIHVYHFHEPNPFEGPFTGRAGHVLDIAYALQTYQHLLPEDSKGVSLEMGKYVISTASGDLDHAHGQSIIPHEVLDGAKEVLVFDTSHELQVMSSGNYDRQFRKGVEALFRRIGIQKVVHCLDLYQEWASLP